MSIILLLLLGSVLIRDFKKRDLNIAILKYAI
jgi:hypothetical protein